MSWTSHVLDLADLDVLLVQTSEPRGVCVCVSEFNFKPMLNFKKGEVVYL